MTNKLTEPAFLVVNKDTGNPVDWAYVTDTAKNAKTRYSYNRVKGQQFKDQTQDVVVQLINPIKLNQMLDDLVGSFDSVDDLVKTLKEQINAA